MQVVHTVSELRKILNTVHDVGFVPTMGNLHAGHIKLVEIAKQHAECVVVSIFVNPLQFGPNEDLASYPRTLQADCEKLKGFADIVFAPNVVEMYPQEQTMTITPPPIANTLCGASRPGHFSGVATVVMKLFNMVQPNVAVFGKKDFQQLFIIQQMVKQFNLPILIMAGETIRESDGLALSSRNGYLSEKERAAASQLNQALQRVANEVIERKSTFDALKISAAQSLTAKGWEVDYFAICNTETLLPANSNDTNLVVLAAAKLGKTRLIDNIELQLK
jgi:pantoate--beta-alanine ligase